MLDFYSESESTNHPQRTIRVGVEFAQQFRPKAVRRAIDYIHTNLASSVRLEDIAGAIGLSVFHFSRKFRRSTGMTPHRFLTQARVDKVKMLLLGSELSLAAIAEETGFSDQSHMSKVFKKLAGTTPKHFRDDHEFAIAVSNCADEREGNGDAARA